MVSVQNEHSRNLASESASEALEMTRGAGQRRIHLIRDMYERQSPFMHIYRDAPKEQRLHAYTYARKRATLLELQAEDTDPNSVPTQSCQTFWQESAVITTSKCPYPS